MGPAEEENTTCCNKLFIEARTMICFLPIKIIRFFILFLLSLAAKQVSIIAVGIPTGFTSFFKVVRCIFS